MEFINRVCEVGVDINQCVAHNHMSNLVQFVAGLGPRKGQALLKTLRQMKSSQRLENRNQLVLQCHMGPNIYVNCAGKKNYFLKNILIYRVFQNEVIYRVNQVKLENCKLLFKTEFMQIFLIKWYFYYHITKNYRECITIQKFRKNPIRHGTQNLLCESQISCFEVTIF